MFGDFLQISPIPPAIARRTATWQSAPQRLLLEVSEAQSAGVNDSPVGCQSRRPGAPQSTAGRPIGLTDVVVCEAEMQPFYAASQLHLIRPRYHSATFPSRGRLLPLRGRTVEDARPYKGIGNLPSFHVIARPQRGRGNLLVQSTGLHRTLGSPRKRGGKKTGLPDGRPVIVFIAFSSCPCQP